MELYLFDSFFLNHFSLNFLKISDDLQFKELLWRLPTFPRLPGPIYLLNLFYGIHRELFDAKILFICKCFVNIYIYIYSIYMAFLLSTIIQVMNQGFYKYHD